LHRRRAHGGGRARRDGGGEPPRGALARAPGRDGRLDRDDVHLRRGAVDSQGAAAGSGRRLQGGMTMQPIVQLQGVSKIYGTGENAVTALDAAALAVRPGELLLIEGPSGSGKTTLLSILGLLLKPTAGQVIVSGRKVSGLSERELPPVRARTFGFIFQ